MPEKNSMPLTVSFLSIFHDVVFDMDWAVKHRCYEKKGTLRVLCGKLYCNNLSKMWERIWKKWHESDSASYLVVADRTRTRKEYLVFQDVQFQGRIRFCALILDFDEKLIFNWKFRKIYVKYGIIG